MIRSKFEEVNKVMSLNSPILSEYFYSLMTNHNIKSIRNGMKVLIFFFYCEIITSHVSERGIIFRPILAFIAFCIYFLTYATTVRVKKSVIMIRYASMMVITSITYTVVLGTDTRELMEIQYSLTIVIILMMYTLFKMRFIITMLLSILYILIFVSIGNYRMKYIDHVNISNLDEPHLETIRSFRTNINDKFYFIAGQCILFLLMYMTGLYLRFFNSIRRKSAFLKLAQNAEAKMKMQSAIQIQIYWIEAIMPKSVKENFLKRIRNNDMYSLVYCKHFENVSILFADIVGFTVMSSNKTAAQLVYLLNDLYNRFDEQGQLTNCEKIGTLGDCYYCVSGCPVPRIDHAMNCVEMGLGMCRIILRFNKDHKEKVNMRVGIHSGRVIAAIIGNHRFRFDVFSNDVIIANSLESSGKPGLVHISEDTYLLVRHAYACDDGEILEIKKEEVYGIGGMIQKTVPMKTYFIIPNKLKRDKRSFRERMLSERNLSNKRLEISEQAKTLFFNNEEISNLYKKKDEKFKGDLKIVRSLQEDPDRTVEFFQNPPINQITLTFEDPQIEYHYLYHTIDQVEKIQIYSIKIALFIDSIASMFYATVLMVASYVMIPKKIGIGYFSPLIYLSGYIFTLIIAYVSLLYKSEISNRFAKGFYCFWSHPVSRLFLGIYISSLPSLLVFTLYQKDYLHNSYHYTSAYFTLNLFALIGNAIFTSSSGLIKHITTALFTFIPIYFIMNKPRVDIDDFQSFLTCTSYLEDNRGITTIRVQFNFSFQYILICLLVYYLIRENEKNIRLNFYATREAEIRNAEAIHANKIAESLLYNIIPKQVFKEIVSKKWSNHREMTFSYAYAFSNAGVVFACISNFFSSYYREDYKGGEVALRLLHTIICTFDNLLHKPIYSKLEKIKTINDCYMLASGLNSDVDELSNDEHLKTLMTFAFDMHHNLRLFNEQNIVGNYTFYLKVGYNCGPITAGIIGTTRPLYDIWGDTVNVASRMYSTSPSHSSIQVPFHVVSKLNSHFEFKYRGNIFVKGKGEMATYLAIRSYDKTFLFVRIFPSQFVHE